MPDVIGATQPIMRIVELLPAPFGPRKPNASPRATSKSMPSTAVNVPKVLVSPRAEMSGAPDGMAPGPAWAADGDGARRAHILRR